MAQKIIRRKSRTKNRLATRANGLSAKVAAVEAEFMRKDLPDFRPGDTIKVHVRIMEGEKERLQAFEGVVLARGNTGAGRSFVVRKMSHGTGVERVFLEASSRVAKIDVVQHSDVRRSKLYYLRGLQGKKARVDRLADTTSTESSKPASA